MTNLSVPSQKLLVNKFFLGLAVLVSLIGFLDSVYLTISHYQGELPACTIVEGCNIVLTSSYSTILGVPISVLGAVYYLTILVGSIAYIDTKRAAILKFTAIATSIGMLASLYFFYLQLAVIKAWCQFCILSLITSTLLFVFGCITYWTLRNKENTTL